MYGHAFKRFKAVVEGVREAGGELILKQVEKLAMKFFTENV